MHAFPFLCLLGAILAAANGRVFKPCELVESVKNLYLLDDNSQIPLIVCIAGYRNYNTSYRLENKINNTGYYGIFGLFNDDVNYTKCAGSYWNVSLLTDDDIKDDLSCLKEIILDSPLNLKFYQGMCGPSMVRKVPCPITNYVQADVYDPIDKDLFTVAFKKGRLPTPPPSTTTPKPAPYCCEKSDNASYFWAFYVTIPAILIVLVFFGVRIAMKRHAERVSAGLGNA